jgi:hypothetical protein
VHLHLNYAHSDWQTVDVLDVREGDRAINGFISYAASHNLRSQFICAYQYYSFLILGHAVYVGHLYADVNSRPVDSPEIHRAINSVFANSTFSRYVAETQGRPSSPSPTKAKVRSKSPRHQAQRHPVFFLDVRWSNSDWFLPSGSEVSV